MKDLLKVIVKAACLFSLTLPASAVPTLYIAEWSGAGLGNSATATAMVTLDPAQNPGDVVGAPFDSFFSAISITISGAAFGGDGTYTTPDFASYIWNGSGVDFSRELVGQAGFQEFNLGPNRGSNSLAPVGVGPFTIQAAPGILSGDRLLLTSLRPAETGAPELNSAGACAPAVICLGFFALYSGRRARANPAPSV